MQTTALRGRAAKCPRALHACPHKHARTTRWVAGGRAQGRYRRLPLTSRNVARLHSSRVIVACLRGPWSRHFASSCCSRNSASTRRRHASVALDILRSGFAMPAPAARNIRTRLRCTSDGGININRGIETDASPAYCNWPRAPANSHQPGERPGRCRAGGRALSGTYAPLRLTPFHVVGA